MHREDPVGMAAGRGAKQEEGRATNDGSLEQRQKMAGDALGIPVAPYPHPGPDVIACQNRLYVSECIQFLQPIPVAWPAQRRLVEAVTEQPGKDRVISFRRTICHHRL